MSHGTLKTRTPMDPQVWPRHAENSDPYGSEVYAELCSVTRLAPRAEHLRTGNRLHLECVDRKLVDDDLLGYSIMLQKKPMQEVDLSKNALLTEDSFVPFLERLCSSSSACITTLQTLRLAGCHGLGDFAFLRLAQSLGRFTKIREVSLAGIRAMSVGTLTEMATVLGEKPLRAVSLADTGINPTLAPRVVASLFENEMLENLDLSWNPFTETVFRVLRMKLTDHDRLKKLCLASTGTKFHVDQTGCGEGGRVPACSPMQVFLEGVRKYSALEELDLSINSLTSRSCCILEASLRYNVALTRLVMHTNPIGPDGCRALLRALSASKKLDWIDLHSMVASGLGGGASGPSSRTNSKDAVSKTTIPGTDWWSFKEPRSAPEDGFDYSV